MRAIRSVISAVLLVNGAAVGLTGWLILRWPAGDAGGLAAGDVNGALAGLAWTATGGVLAWLRPRNAVGWLLVAVGTCQSLSVALAAYGGYGLAVASPAWPLAQWSAWLGSALWLPGLLPLGNVLLALYPNGALPGSRWKWPVVATIAGTTLLTLALLADQSSYDEIAPGSSPLSISAAPWLTAVYLTVALTLLIGGTLCIWAMSWVRMWRADAPERQQLAWLLLGVAPLCILIVAGPLAPEWVSDYVGVYLIPVGIGIGVFRYNLLGIAAILRRGLVYGALTLAVGAAYLGATALAGTGASQTSFPALLAAGAVAVGLTPLRERLQRGVDRIVYGERADPMAAVTRLGDLVAAAAPDDLLTSVLTTVTGAVQSPGASVVAPDGRVLACVGKPTDAFTLPLTVSGTAMGTLRVACRDVEPYSSEDHRLLSALAPQVAVVVRALDLAEVLEAHRDLLVEATRAERERLRRDLHDGLGPSLSGVGLGLQALEEAIANADQAKAGELASVIRGEITSAVVEVRRILDDLMPLALIEDGLAGAVRRHAATLAPGLSVEVDAGVLPRLSPEVEAAAYRIVREALINVATHAHATSARLVVDVAEDTLRVQISDDGTGLRPIPDDAPAPRVGMSSMRHRAEALGGQLTVASSGCGTTVCASLPLRPA